MIAVAARRPDLARVVKRAIEQSSLDQTQIARKVGASQATVSRWATATASPQTKYWKKIHTVLGVDLATISLPDGGLDELRAQIEQLRLAVLVLARHADLDVSRFLGGLPRRTAVDL